MAFFLVHASTSFLWTKLHQKSKLKIKKNDFGSFQSSKVKKIKIIIFLYLVFIV